MWGAIVWTNWTFGALNFSRAFPQEQELRAPKVWSNVKPAASRETESAQRR